MPGKKVCATSGISWQLRSYHRSERSAERTNFSLLWPLYAGNAETVHWGNHSAFPSWQCCFASTWLGPNFNVTSDKLLGGGEGTPVLDPFITRFMLLEMQISVIWWIWDTPPPSNSGTVECSDFQTYCNLWAYPVKVTVENEGSYGRDPLLNMTCNSPSGDCYWLG